MVWVGLILCVIPFLQVEPIKALLPSSSVQALIDARIRYIILTVAQALYAYFIEGDIVFVGKRKTFDKRVRHMLVL